jgi:hypothetical protein
MDLSFVSLWNQPGPRENGLVVCELLDLDFLIKGIFARGHSTTSFFAAGHHSILPLLLDTF